MLNTERITMTTFPYTPGKNEFWPVPYNQLYYVPGLYTQNKGYND